MSAQACVRNQAENPAPARAGPATPSRPLHIVLAGPIAGDDIAGYLYPSELAKQLPIGYLGAPLMGILIGQLLALGHRVTGITTDSALSHKQGAITRQGPGFSFVVCPARPQAWRNNGWRLGRVVDLFSQERSLIRSAMLAARPDIVHAHWSYEFALAAIDQPAPHLITCHDAPAVVLRFTRSPYRALRYLMARQVFRRGNAFTTVSDYMARELAPALHAVPQVVANPVAPYVFALGRDRQWPATRKVVMVCNGWNRLKNPEPALRGFALWRATEPLAELHLYGADFGPGERGQLWAVAHGMADGVHFHGRLPHLELVQRMAMADVLLHTSLEESFGVVLAEAMALGLPVVAGRHSGAVPWVVGTDDAGQTLCGHLVDVVSPVFVSHGLIAAFDSAYGSYSAAGRLQAVQRFSPTTVASTYTDLYATILETKHVRPPG